MSTLLHQLVLLIVCFIYPMSGRYSTKWDWKGWPSSEMYYGCLWSWYMMVKRVSFCFSDESSTDKPSLLIDGAQYFKSVTSGSYDLSEICDEYRVQAENAEKDTVLPERVGVSRVHLWLEIKNTNLDPVPVKVLQSGIAVYVSPFKISMVPGWYLRVLISHFNAVFLIRERVY